MPQMLRPGDLAGIMPAAGLVLVSSCSAESDLLAAEVARVPGNQDYCGVFVPGLNRQMWRGADEARVTTFFRTPDLTCEVGRVRFLPLCYQDILRFVRTAPPVAALFMCSPPDAHGLCSFGTEVALIAALWREVPVRIAHINPLMPRTPGDPGIPFAQLAGWFEGEQALRGTPRGQIDPVAKRIARHVAAFVPDGSTLQIGLGKVPDAVLAALSGHRNLRLHSGLIGDGALDLVRSGALASGPSATVGVAIGSEELYAALDDPHFDFRPVTATHDPATLAALPRLVTINSAMEVDLYGQVHAEASVRGFQSGPGGASDYARGARASAGGLRIIALPASAGDASRIVAPGAGHGPVSLSRFDVDVVVTEHGAADLRLKTYNARAAALIEIAAPEHREGLERAFADVTAVL